MVGATWEMEEQLPAMAWHAPRDVDADKKDEIVKAVENDLKWMLPWNYQVYTD